jgi:hypothetical protein
MHRCLSLVVGFFVAGSASAAALDAQQMLTFSGYVSSIEDPGGALQGAVALGDSFTVSVVIPVDLAAVGLNVRSSGISSAHAIDVAGLVWATTGVNTLLGSGYDFYSSPFMYLYDDAAAGDYFNFTTDPIGVSYGSPIAAVPYWEGNVGSGSVSRAAPISVDPFEAPDLSTFAFSSAYVWLRTGKRPGFEIKLFRTHRSVDPQPSRSCSRSRAGSSSRRAAGFAARASSDRSGALRVPQRPWCRRPCTGRVCAHGCLRAVSRMRSAL